MTHATPQPAPRDTETQLRMMQVAHAYLIFSKPGLVITTRRVDEIVEELLARGVGAEVLVEAGLA